MARLNYFLLCENLIVNKSTNMATIVNVFDVVNAEKFPAVASNFTVAFNFRPEKAELEGSTLKMKILGVDSKGKELLKAEAMHATEDIKGNVAGSIILGGKLGFKSEIDNAALKLYVNDKEIAHYSFSVKQATKEANN